MIDINAIWPKFGPRARFVRGPRQRELIAESRWPTTWVRLGEGMYAREPQARLGDSTQPSHTRIAIRQPPGALVRRRPGGCGRRHRRDGAQRTRGAAGRRARRHQRSFAAALSGRAQRALRGHAGDHAGRDQHPLQQLLRVRHQPPHLSRGGGAQDQAVGDPLRRACRKSVQHRHRRSVEARQPRGAGVPPPLPRAAVDGGAMDRICAGAAGRDGASALRGEIRADGGILRSGGRRRGRSSSGIRGPTSRASPWRRRPTNWRSW